MIEPVRRIPTLDFKDRGRDPCHPRQIRPSPAATAVALALGAGLLAVPAAPAQAGGLPQPTATGGTGTTGIGGIDGIGGDPGRSCPGTAGGPVAGRGIG
ncbi:hypothetical protein [Streptomyces sp. NPDC006668]|uniref:hypothetical protein n=1 Tax=Streptomyces sp. NPDC006668 TaxID=3156903 RepID=UPI0033DE2EB0